MKQKSGSNMSKLGNKTHSMQNWLQISQEVLSAGNWFTVTYFNQVLVHRKLVQCQGPSFVTTQDIHASHFLNGSHSFSNGSLHKFRTILAC
jgi:hypothetical protein